MIKREKYLQVDLYYYLTFFILLHKDVVNVTCVDDQDCMCNQYSYVKPLALPA